jgi:phosphohistidine phosphatase
MTQMRLYVMRHADADRSAWDGDDFERPLTEKGRARTLAMAEHLDAIGVAPRRIVTSPLARAAQTAAIVAEVLGGIETLVQDDRLGPGFGVDRLARIVEDNAEAEALLLVGHEPALSRVVGDLIGGGDVVMKKGAVACVDLGPSIGKGGGAAPPSGTLLWLLSPGSLGF